MSGVHRNDAPARRLVIRLEEQPPAGFLDERVGGPKPREDGLRRRRRRAAIHQVHLALVARPLEGGDHGPAIVVAHLHAEDRLALIRRFDDQRVLLLPVSEAVVIDLIEVVLVTARD
jgi:hypothetical protein